MTTLLTWDEDRVKDLLRQPHRLLADSLWRQAIQQYGGIQALYDHLAALPLKKAQLALLNALLAEPGAPVADYCAQLHIHETTFHRQQQSLCKALAAHLNEAAASAQPTPRQAAGSLHQLPAPVADFIGRSAEAAALCDAFRSGTTISGIHGMGGVGKTELALWVARELAGDFPDGQIVLALHGARELPLSTARALQSVIRHFSPDEQLPLDEEPLVQRYRSCLHGKRVLILADDARDAAHVRPLLPPDGCALLITSRQRFVLPGMTSVDLEALPPEAAQALLRNICGRVSEAEAEAITAAVGALPLAIRASGSILRTTPALPVARYMHRLADTRQRLALLRDPEDPQLDVESSLEFSYASLDEAAQQALRAISVLVADFPLELGLTLVDMGAEEQGEEVLYRLLRRNLLLYDQERDRWLLHDLVRVLALKKAEAAAEIAAAQRRYTQGVYDLLREIREQHLRGGDEIRQSMRRFDQERPHFDAMWHLAEAQAGTPQGDELMVRLIIDAQGLIHLRDDVKTQLLPKFTAALEAAQRLEDGMAIGLLVWRLGTLEMTLGNVDRALQRYESAVRELQITGPAHYLTGAQTDLAGMYIFRGGEDNYRRAITLYRELLLAYAQVEARYRQDSTCLNNMGIAHTRLGELDEAHACYDRSLQIALQTGALLDQCRALANLGDLAILRRQPEQAIDYSQRALALAVELKHRQGEAIITSYLAKAYHIAGDPELTDATFAEALSLTAALGDRWSEADMRWQYGQLLIERGEQERGLEHMRASMAYKREISAGTLAEDAALLARLESGEQLGDGPEG